MPARPPSSLVPSASSLVGTPKGRLGAMEAELLKLPWQPFGPELTGGRELLLRRRTEPNAEQQLLLSQLQFVLPSQPPPKITAM